MSFLNRKFQNKGEKKTKTFASNGIKEAAFAFIFVNGKKKKSIQEPDTQNNIKKRI